MHNPGYLYSHMQPFVYIAEAGSKGRGVFTHDFIPEGTIIETAPVIVMTARERELLDQTTLHDYIFEWQPGGQNLCCMALGWIPVFNHSYSSNCEYFMDYEEQTMLIQSVRDIAAGEELTINYNGNWNDEKKLWFDAE